MVNIREPLGTLLILKLVILSNCAIVFEKNTHGVVSKIYGGNPVITTKENDVEKYDSYPFMASLERYNIHQCGAVIINLQAVLTAAHCVHGYSRKVIKIVAGTIKRNTNGENVQIRKVSTFVINENYQPKSFDNDIAVIILEKRFKDKTYVNTIQIPSTNYRDRLIGKEVTILGWGRTELKESSDDLIKASAKLMSFEECKNKISKLIPLSISKLCVITAKMDVGVGKGDSGGPLVKIHKDGSVFLLGIASHFISYKDTTMTDTKFPSMYIDVAKLKPWIKEILTVELKYVKKNRSKERF